MTDSLNIFIAKSIFAKIMKISNLENTDPDSITNIVLDWGGVIVNIDYDKTVDAFRELGFADFRSFYHQKVQNDFFIQFETGKVNSVQLRDFIRQELNKNLDDDDINRAWCAMILDIPPSRIDTLNRLKSKYRIVLLSNTNQLHEELIIPRLNEELGIEFLSLFDRYYFSHHIGMRKPDTDIYRYVLADDGMQAERTLFVDDTEMNIDTAADMGIRSCYLQSGSDIVELFRDW